MRNNTESKLPVRFWTVVTAAVIWNLLGVMAYVMQVTMSAETIAGLPEVQQALYAAQPAWLTGAFAIAVFAGLVGSIALALRKRVATLIFAVSLVAVIIQMFYMFALSNTLAVMGVASAVLPSLIVLIAGVLIWFSIHATAKGWAG